MSSKQKVKDTKKPGDSVTRPQRTPQYKEKKTRVPTQSPTQVVKRGLNERQSTQHRVNKTILRKNVETKAHKGRGKRSIIALKPVEEQEGMSTASSSVADRKHAGRASGEDVIRQLQQHGQLYTARTRKGTSCKKRVRFDSFEGDSTVTFRKTKTPRMSSSESSNNTHSRMSVLQTEDKETASLKQHPVKSKMGTPDAINISKQRDSEQEENIVQEPFHVNASLNPFTEIEYGVADFF